MRSSSMLLMAFFFSLTGCEKIALMATPSKKPVPSTSALAHRAKNYFWHILHQGNYQDITRADSLLMAAYLQNPNDEKLAAYIGFLHIWKITERQRLPKETPLITNEIILAKKYFSDALQLNPDMPIYEGFLGDSELIEGKIFHDKREEVRGYFRLKHAIARWPEFNYFTAGYPMSTLPHNSSHFKEGLEWQWETLNLCAGEKVNRMSPSFANYMHRETSKGKQRACWNSSIAPHNFEGFFLNMGDMLVKSGDWQTGVAIYQNAKLSKTYTIWPYKHLLEKRIVNAKANVNNFRKKHTNPHQAVLFNSGYGCVACHQR
ncbi:hypothetical protein [Legionella jamestowniensis]|uniref:Tetratricopeptide repeat protein n=1 Tax=Legionella jamestowniensis TaxID=455 RepID=A0A0W0UJG9_9GAMM|nr:hypothetical protein [Legionella jamestowniensis]KTD08048.1 hypothetical protein Ljam_2243 [Legionella jamestowniensis]OCH97329.1 hypothetical protein A8135_03480 [Legionella jamestowniensis]SFM06026.1 hypothetical protein SAMN02746073_0189 [Legionella jamestowniensis DSM 19215]